MGLRVPLYPAEKAARPSKVMVTGVTGYVSGHIVQRLLAVGHTVHGTCRAPERKETVAHLLELPGASERLRLFKGDLLQPGSFDAAIEGCDFVVHTASPFIVNVGANEVQEKLIKPALQGTANVLEAVSRAGTVKRVVLTSSCASIYGNPDERGPNHIFSEDEWDTTASETVIPYSYSKTVAERKAWEMACAQNRWELAVVNPSLVMGPVLTARSAEGESVGYCKSILSNEFYPACPRIGIGLVDVRDVAAMHSLAMVTPAAAGKRFIACADSKWLYEMVDIVRQARPSLGVKSPYMSMPKWLLWLMAPLLGMRRDSITHSVGLIPRFTNKQAREVLGVSFLPLAETLGEMADSLKQFKIVK